DGLGRNKDGITKPLKANYKFDNAGFGHNIADDMNNSWWENVYNNASKNLIAETNELKEVTVASTSQNNEEPDKLKASEYAGSFLKGATLINQRQEVDCEHKAEISPVILRVVSDEELFKACGGRTAHKGGRHGLNLTGKLSRIEQQERELSSKIRSGKEKSSQVFKEYVERKSLSNKRKLKRLNEKKIKKVKKSVASTSTTIPTPTLQAP
ncbi:G patch domain-containing protein 4, partial [Pseudolycoriella hygida]